MHVKQESTVTETSKSKLRFDWVHILWIGVSPKLQNVSFDHCHTCYYLSNADLTFPFCLFLHNKLKYDASFMNVEILVLKVRTCLTFSSFLCIVKDVF